MTQPLIVISVVAAACLIIGLVFYFVTRKSDSQSQSSFTFTSKSPIKGNLGSNTYIFPAKTEYPEWMSFDEKKGLVTLSDGLYSINFGSVFGKAMSCTSTDLTELTTGRRAVAVFGGKGETLAFNQSSASESDVSCELKGSDDVDSIELTTSAIVKGSNGPFTLFSFFDNKPNKQLSLQPSVYIHKIV
jgi:hypothetical protein